MDGDGMDRIMLKSMNDTAKEGGGRVEKDSERKEFVVYDENDEEVYSSSTSSEICGWLEFRNAFGIPYSARPDKRRRRKRGYGLK